MALGSFLTRAIAACGLLAATASQAAAQRAPADTGGFVINDPLVVSKCQKCHARDSTGHMGRLSYLRKTPEGWEASVRRMASLADVQLQPADARAIVKYLANKQGLAPAEVKEGRFELERRLIDYKYSADAVTERTCRACHSVGRVLLQRRTKLEWELLIATHRGYYPNSDFQAFRRMGPASDSAPAPHPMDQAIAHLSKVFPLQTPEWTAWSATMRPAPVEGSWALTGYEVGRGALFGRLTVTKVPGTDDEFTTRATYRFASGGAPVAREGKVVVYTGHQWRGRSGAPGSGPDSSWREVLSIEPGWQEMSGRWYRGGYDEIGIDVSAQRISGGAQVLGVVPRALKRGTRDTEVTVFGANLPRGVAASAIDFGPGVTVTRVVRATPDEVVVRVNVDADARMGSRDLVVAGAALRQAVVAYEKVDRIRVSPNSNMARVGGVRFPKQLARFEALGISYGA
ncbi:MAG TPA: quinohemoprotein amine dehydrogenase subunit alpha, partial [Gemmatimonadaceae bacterium]|nr:quinohemoprotein amine dehydrogenase subunit alpha [Gemmatimonadaceae bacterium]